jgi:hypothetical protein
MSKANPSILQCNIWRLARIVSRKRVCRKDVGLMGARVGSGHLIVELDRVMRELSGGEVPEPQYLYVGNPMGEPETWFQTNECRAVPVGERTESVAGTAPKTRKSGYQETEGN